MIEFMKGKLMEYMEYMEYIKLEITNPDRPSFHEEHTFSDLERAKKYINSRYGLWQKSTHMCNDLTSVGLTYWKDGVRNKLEAFIVTEERIDL